MNLLAYIERKHPVGTTVSGILGGAFSGSMKYLQPITEVVSLLGAVLGLFVAAVSAWMKWQAWRHSVKCRRAPYQEPPPEVDDVPM